MTFPAKCAHVAIQTFRRAYNAELLLWFPPLLITGFSFGISHFFVSADFFRWVELSDHIVNLGKTTVCRLCSLHYM